MKTTGAAVESATLLQSLLRAVRSFGQHCSGQWQPCLPSAGGVVDLNTGCIWLRMMQRASWLLCPEEAAFCILGNRRMQKTSDVPQEAAREAHESSCQLPAW